MHAHKPTRSALNPHGERELLSSGNSAWQGLPVTWVEAHAHVSDGGFVVPSSVLVMLDAGSARASMRVGRRSQDFDLRPDSLALFAQGTEIGMSNWECLAARRIFIQLDPTRLADAEFAQVFQSSALHTVMDWNDAELSKVLRLAVNEVRLGSPNGALYAESLSLGIASRVRRMGMSTPTGAEKGRLSATQVRRLSDLFDKRLAEDLRLAELAAEVGYSVAQFSRLFRNTYGCPPYRHLLQLRVRRACELLVQHQGPISVIASEVGFSSQSHMTTAFVRILHTTPAEFRRGAGIH